MRCKHEQGVRLKNQDYAEKQREQMSETKEDLIKMREACTQTEPHIDAAFRDGKNTMEEAEAGYRAEERLVRAAEDAHRNARVMCRILVHVQDGLALDRLTLESNIQKLGNVSNKIEAVLKKLESERTWTREKPFATIAYEPARPERLAESSADEKIRLRANSPQQSKQEMHVKTGDAVHGELVKGTRVITHDLKSCELNNKTGRIREWIEDKQRYVVELDGGRVICARKENLRGIDSRLQGMGEERCRPTENQKRTQKEDKSNTSEQGNNESDDTGSSVLIERVALELIEAVEKELKGTKKGEVSRNEIMKHATFWTRLVVMHHGQRKELPEECMSGSQRLTDLRQQVWKRVNCLAAVMRPECFERPEGGYDKERHAAICCLEICRALERVSK